MAPKANAQANPKAKATAKGNGKGGNDVNDDGSTMETFMVTEHIDQELYIDEMLTRGGWSRERAIRARGAILEQHPERFSSDQTGKVFLIVNRQQTVITFE